MKNTLLTGATVILICLLFIGAFNQEIAFHYLHKKALEKEKAALSFGGGGGPTYFAQVDGSGVVQRVIVITQAMVDTGKWGDPSTFIQTSMDGSIAKNYAAKGYTYDSSISAFVAPKPTSDATFSSSTAQWTVPDNRVAAVATTTP